MKQIPLTRGQFAIVDDEDFDRLNAFKWYARWESCPGSFYAGRGSAPDVTGKRCIIRMHREIVNAPTGSVVDHVNHDTLDNRKENLRICSSQQNNANMRMRKDNASGFKGVSWDKQREKWMAQASVGGKSKNIGYFVTPLEAAIAYDKTAVEYHGEFALTNRMMGLIP